MAAYYYVVPAVQDEEGSYNPDVPVGTSWVGDFHLATTDYLIKTLSPVSGATALTIPQLETECTARGLNVNDVRYVWAIGGDTGEA